MESRLTPVGTLTGTITVGRIKKPIQLQEKTIQATKADLEVTADDGYDGLEKVNIEGYPLNNQEKTVQATKSDLEVTADDGYDGLAKVTVEGYEVENQSKTVEPQVNSQQITADEGYDGLAAVSIGAVTSSIDDNIQPENIKKNTTILGITGSYEGEVDICEDLEDWRNLDGASTYRQTDSFARFVIKHSPVVLSNINHVFDGWAKIEGELDLSRFDLTNLSEAWVAFLGCKGITKLIFNPDKDKGFYKLTTSSAGAGLRGFARNCTALREVINFPIHLMAGNTSGLTETNSDAAFYGCTALEKITFPSGCVPCSGKTSADYTFTILYFTEAVTEANLLAMLETLGQNTTGRTRAFKLHANVFPTISEETKAAFVAKGYALVE